MPINLSQVKSLRSKFEKQGSVYAEFDEKDAHDKLHGKPAPYQFDDDEEDEEEDEAQEAGDDEDEEGGAEGIVDGDASDSDLEEADRVLNGGDDGLTEEELAAAEADLIAQAETERLAKHDRKMQKKAAKQEAAKEKQAHSLAINFAKRLAHNDKKVRDQTIKTLRRWLLRREHMDHRDLMKIWKGLFYCFWMSDKVPVQQQLADALSDLLLPPLEFDRALLFFSSFLITCAREWTAIDQLRMDKFMTLVRRFMQKMFQTLQAEGWKDEQVKAVTEELLVEHALGHSTSCRGFAFHLMDVFLSEIERVSAANPSKAITFEALNTLLTPFYHILARSRDQTVVDRTKKEVFDTLRDICATPLPEEPEEEEPKPKKKEQPKKGKNTKKSKKVPQEDEEDEDMEVSEEEEEEEEQAPAVEGIAADFPVLHQVLDGQAGAISEILFTLATDPEILPRSRKLLYSYRAEFDEIQRLAEEEDDEEDEQDVSEAAAAAAAALAATQLPTRKRKRGDNEGEQQQQQPPNSRKEAGKKKNRRQRLAEKRRKKEALFGAEPGRQSAEQEQGDNEEGDEEDGEEYDEEMDEDDDGEGMDFDDEEMDDIDMDASDLDDDEQFGGAAEAEEDDMIALKTKLSKKEQKKLEAALQAKQAAAAAAAAEKNNKKNSKKKIVPEVVEAEPEEEEEEEEPQPKKKKQKTSTAPVAPAKPTETVSSKKESKKTQSAHTPAQPEPTPAPASPKQKSQSPIITPTKAPQSNGFSTPSHSQSTIKPALKTVTVPPSSSKKSVKIMLSENKVKQFNKWARDSVTKDTPSLLAQPSPKSAIKAESIEFFLKHNKNGRELAARQSKLQLNLSAAAGDKKTPPVSPSRQKASDFF